MLRRARTKPFISDLGIGRGRCMAVRLGRPRPAIALDRVGRAELPSLGNRISGRLWRMVDSVRQRMVVLFILILLLPSVVTVMLAINAYRQQSEQAHNQVRQYAGYAAIFQEQLLTGVRHTLRSFAISYAEMPATDCAARLAAAASPYSQFTDVFFTEAGGAVTCASDPAAIGSSVAAQPWFRQMAAKPGFVVGDYMDGGQAAPRVLVVGQALGDASAPFSGAIGAAIKLDWLGELSRSLGLPPDSIVDFLDRGGAPILGGSTMGLPAAEVLRGSLRDASGIFDARDGAGRWRVYGSAVVADSNIRVLIGVPAAPTTTWIYHDVFFRIVTLLVLWILILFAAWVGVDRLVIEWIRLLNRATLAFSRGETVPLNLGRAPAELRQLGGTFGTMAEQVRAREAELRGSLAQQEWLVKETHHRVKNNLQIVASLINLRAKTLRSADAREAFADIQMPIRALALVHRHLYDSGEHRIIDLQPIVMELCQLFRDGGELGPVHVKLTSDVPRLPLTADRAVPVILLATEALTGAFRHVRGGGNASTISVALNGDGDRAAVLEIADDAGSVEEEAVSAAGRLRASLMDGLARQVGGTLSRIGPPRTGVSLRFRFDASSPSA